MEKFKFGLDKKGVELKAILDRRQALLKSGNPVTVIDAQLDEYSDYILDPRMDVILNVMAKATSLTETDKTERAKYIKAKEDFRKNFVMAPMADCIKEILQGKTAKIAKITKKVESFNGKVEEKTMSYLPGELREFYKIKDISVFNMPTSVLRAIVEVDTLELTREDILKLRFVSVACDKYTMNFEQHSWSVIYDLKDEIKLTAEEQFNLDSMEDDMI